MDTDLGCVSGFLHQNTQQFQFGHACFSNKILIILKFVALGRSVQVVAFLAVLRYNCILWHMLNILSVVRAAGV